MDENDQERLRLAEEHLYSTLEEAQRALRQLARVAEQAEKWTSLKETKCVQHK